MEDHCLDLDEVDEELSDLEADTHAVEDRGAREESQGEDQCVRKGPNSSLKQSKPFFQKQEDERKHYQE